MTHTQNKTDTPILCGFAVLAVFLGIVSFSLSTLSGTQDSLHGAAPENEETSGMQATIATDKTSSTALRLQQRLAGESGKPNLLALQQSLQDRQSILERSVTVEVRDDSRPEVLPVTWTIDFAKHPELLTMRHTWASATFVLNEDILREYVEKGIFGETGRRVSIVVQDAVTDKHGVMRAQNTQVARDGFEYDMEKLSDAVGAALRNGVDSVVFQASYKPGTVQYAVDGNIRELSLLSTGKSEFSNSPDNRIWNVRKSINEHTNNIIVPQGAKFSYVDALDVPVTTGKGWMEGMGLFGGGTAMTPGGGICQAATTVYRAALLAGLPIAYRRYHSMFVDHYEQYGIGLDATVFPGVHDMAFKNDTSDVMLVQAYIVGEEVFVKFYGIPDERMVTMDGPYFNNTPNRPKQIRPLDWDEIGWTRTVTYSDGRTETKPIVSTYVQGFARSIKNKYAGTLGKKLLEIKEPGATVATLDTSY